MSGEDTVAKTISSTFDKNLQGWSEAPGTTGATHWSKTGGDPGGFLAWRTGEFSGMMLEAPDKFLGDMHRYYKGTFSFDYYTKSNFNGYVGVTFKAADGTYVSGSVQTYGDQWHNFSISLNSHDLFDHPSAGEIKHVLSNLVEVDFYLSVSIDVSGGLDNITFAPRDRSAQDHVPASAFSPSDTASHDASAPHLFAAHALHPLEHGAVLA